MAQKASAPAIYEVLTISKDGKEVPLQGKTINFNYYESLYSPVVTANMMFVDAGGTTPDKKENVNKAFCLRDISTMKLLYTSLREKKLIDEMDIVNIQELYGKN